MPKVIRKLTRVGRRSLAIVIPAKLVDELGLRERQKMVVHRYGKKIIIEDWEDK